MIRTLLRATLALLITVGSMGLFLSASFAAPQDYSLEVLHQPVKAGQDASFSLQVKRVSSGKVISDAAISEPKLHMVMGSMDMPISVRPLSSEEKDIYRFGGNLTMYGEHTLDLTVTVPGEKEPIHTTIKFQVVK